MVRQRVEATFDRLRVDYDKATASSLAEWASRFFVDSTTAHGLWVAADLVPRLCAMVSSDEMSVPSPFDARTLDRLCTPVRAYLSPAALHSVLQQLDAARSLPLTEWEHWLATHMRMASGDSDDMGPIEMTAEVAESIMRNERAYTALDALVRSLSTEQREAFDTWLVRQAQAAGVPLIP